MRPFVTVDETWIHRLTPESNEQSMQAISGETAPKKARTSLSANRVIVSVVMHDRGVIHVDYLEKVRTITGEYFSNILGRFDSELLPLKKALSIS